MSGRKWTEGAVPATPDGHAQNLPTIKAGFQAWYSDMGRAGQMPVVLDWAPIIQDNGKSSPYIEQLHVIGREYEHERDADRWRWMRDHEGDVMNWLKGLGFVARV